MDHFSGICAERLFIRCFQVELEFRQAGFILWREDWKTRESIPSEQGRESKTRGLYSHIASSAGFEPGP